MSEAAAAIVSTLFNRNAPPSVSDPELLQLECREKKLNIEMREIEVANAKAEADQKKTTVAAFQRARMVQDFLKSGLSYEQAKEATNELLGPQT